MARTSSSSRSEARASRGDGSPSAAARRASRRVASRAAASASSTTSRASGWAARGSPARDAGEPARRVVARRVRARRARANARRARALDARAPPPRAKPRLERGALPRARPARAKPLGRRRHVARRPDARRDLRDDERYRRFACPPASRVGARASRVQEIDLLTGALIHGLVNSRHRSGCVFGPSRVARTQNRRSKHLNFADVQDSIHNDKPTGILLFSARSAQRLQQRVEGSSLGARARTRRTRRHPRTSGDRWRVRRDCRRRAGSARVDGRAHGVHRALISKAELPSRTLSAGA